MSVPINALYAGTVSHKRVAPVDHTFKYSVFYLLIDLDSFETSTKLPWCLSLDRFNLFSIYQKNYGAKMQAGLKAHITEQLTKLGIDRIPHKIFMLTMPRVLGYAFNPITLFYCYDTSEDIFAVIYEVHNTFGETHSYLIPVDMKAEKIADHAAKKQLYVSPFYDVSGQYRFRVTPPKDALNLLIHYLTDTNDLRMTADLATERKPLRARYLLGQFFKIPFMTLKVVSAIHFEALRLWVKRVSLVSRPLPPARYSAPSQNK